MALPFPNIDPVIVKLGGSLAISWYSLSYVVGILLGWYYGKKLINTYQLPISLALLEQFISWAIIGIIIGGRLGYVCFYDPITFLHHPLDILKTYEGGMSFHGGWLGILISSWLFCYKYKVKWLVLTDILATVAPIGIGLARIANFINGELYGRITDVPWAVVFPTADGLPRHPSQIYEALLEGGVLFIILQVATVHYRSLRFAGLNSGIFLVGYATARIGVEFWRQPDAHIGYIGSCTLGQLLSLPLMLIGIALLVRSYNLYTNSFDNKP